MNITLALALALVGAYCALIALLLFLFPKD